MDVVVERTKLYSVLSEDPSREKRASSEDNAAQGAEKDLDKVAVTLPSNAASKLPGARFAPRRIRVVCLKMNVRYFDSNDYDAESDLAEEFVGEFCVLNDRDSLVNVRAALHQQLEPDRIPIKFHFVKSQHDQFEKTDPKNQKLLWIETVPWHMEPKTLLSECIRPQSDTLLLTAPISITRPQLLTGNESIEDMRAQWNREKQALIMEIRALEAKLADARKQDELSPNNSLLKRALISLQKEGFIASDHNLDDLEAEYLKIFSRNDVDTIFSINEGNPFRFVWRRLAGDPKAMRGYLEALQSVLIKYRIRKQRLSSRFWMRVLREMRFVADPSLFHSWAEKLPWTQDDSERSAYLGGLVLADSFGSEEFRLLQDSIPGQEDGSQSSVDGDGEAAPRPRRMSSIALAAGQFQARSIERRNSMDATADGPAVSRTNVPSDHPCDHFQVDVLAAQFGICLCGFSRQEHLVSKPAKIIERAKASEVVKNALIPCKSFALDVAAPRFGVCVCGFRKEDHVPTESYEEGPLEQLRLTITKQRERNPQSHPCSDYHVDLAAPRYGTCLCGHDKSKHSASSLRTSSVGDMAEVDIEQSLNNDAKAGLDDEDPLALSKARAQNAFRWVEGEISRLIRRIEILGRRNETTGNLEITFGELFARYQDISDTLVGILVRAKRRKIIDYNSGLGDMLLQGRHDGVVITLLQDQAASWRRARETATTAPSDQGTTQSATQPPSSSSTTT